MTGSRPGRLGAAARSLAPGVVVAAVAAAVATSLAAIVPALSSIAVAVVLGIALAEPCSRWSAAQPGLQTAGRQLLRAAVVLLGLRLSVGDVVALGPQPLMAAVVVVLVLATSVPWLARRLGAPAGLGRLAGVGFAVCGASAIAAARSTVDADEHDVTAALGLVLAFGTLSVLVLPPLATLLSLPAATAGTWFGLAIPDVGQVVAAAELGPAGALDTAIVVKLARVLLLGPALVILAILTAARPMPTAATRSVVPAFVVGFGVLVALRSLGVVPSPIVLTAAEVEPWLFAMAIFALGTEVRVARLRAAGPRTLRLGVFAWLAITVLSLAASIVAVGLG